MSQPLIPVSATPAAQAAAQADQRHQPPILIARFKRLRSPHFVNTRLAVLTAVYQGGKASRSASVAVPALVVVIPAIGLLACFLASYWT